jgi:hypothetical protein
VEARLAQVSVANKQTKKTMQKKQQKPTNKQNTNNPGWYPSRFVFLFARFI